MLSKIPGQGELCEPDLRRDRGAISRVQQSEEEH